MKNGTLASQSGEASPRIQVLGHAALRINACGRELLCDPWIVGSSYWRSWWNYPPVPEAFIEDLRPDFVYLTHLHWDHFHGPSLRRFSRDTHFFVPYLRYDRMVRDLRTLGFTKITEIRHGQRLELAPRFAIRCYQMGPIFTDSAVVIEADDITILNANDAKLAGPPLRQILNDYPNIDFCLRSHSSANARRCMHVTDEPDASLDDDTHYVSSFTSFMNYVRPRFAIPFASNNCFLHKDVFGMNAFAQTPLRVKQHFENFARREGLATELKIMIAGDSWSPAGFVLAKNDCFEARESRLVEYAVQVKPVLERFYAKEDKARVSLALMEKFFGEVWMKASFFLKRRIRKEKILIVSISGDYRDYFVVDLRSGKVHAVSKDEASAYPVRAEFPAMILAQSMRMNMFTQAWISKRVHYHSTRTKMFVLKDFLRILELFEAELLPLRCFISFRTFRALLPRWREGMLYMQVILHLLKRRSFPEIEARLLQR